MNIKRALVCWAIVAGTAMAERTGSSPEEKWSRFHIPGAALKNADLESVLRALEKSSLKYSKQISGKDGALKIHLAEGTKATLTGKIPSQSLTATLYQIAGQTGMSLSFEDNGAHLRPIAANPTRGKFQLTVWPNFLSNLARRTNVSVISAGGPPEVFLRMQGEDLKRALTELGVLVEEKSTIAFNPGTTQLELNSTHHEHERMKTFLKSMHQNPHQIRTTAKLVKGPVNFSIATGEFDRLGVQKLMRKASAMEGFELHTLPSMVMLSGQSGNIEMIRNEAFFDDELWLGEKLEVRLNLRGEGISGSYDFRHRERGSDGRAEALEGSLTGVLALAKQETLVKKVEMTDGSSAFLLISVEVIDAAGRRVE